MRKILISLSLMLMALSSNLFAQEITPGKEVDLGLPSGTIWAGWNVGASSPEEYGGYYAWGETEEESEYAGSTYEFYDCQTDYYTNIGSNISGTKYDVARQKWGGSWRMPTKAEFDELTSKCIWTWCQYKGVWGRKVTGPNGNSIFLPAAGSRSSDILYEDGEEGSYWCASLFGDDGGLAWRLILFNGGYDSGYYEFCYNGLSVRPVKSK